MAQSEPRRPRKKRRAAPQEELRTLDDLRQVRALADPLRIRILTALAEEERTTKQVADLLREKPTRLYHHVDALERAGLVRLSRTQQKRGTVEKYYRAVARTFEARLSTEAKSSRGAIDGFVGTMFETTASELRSLLRGASHGGAKLEKEGILTFVEIPASKAEIETIRRRIRKLIASLDKPARGARKSASPDERYRLTLAFYPLDAGDGARPRRRPHADTT